MKKSLFLTFIFSLIPGGGQMYQEYMKKGVSLLICAIVPIVLATIFSAPIFTLVLPIVFMYSFFDSFKLRNRAIDNREIAEDKYIWDEEIFSGIKKKSWLKKKNVVLGVVLLTLGVYYFIDTFVLNLFHQIGVDNAIIYAIGNILRYIPTLALATLAMVIGCKLITNKERE